MAATALIVDDESDIRTLIALALERIGLDTHTAANLVEAHTLLETYVFDVCLTDMRLPDGSGLELVRHVQATRPTLPIAVITAHGNMEAAVEAMKCGAFDFVSKPVEIKLLRDIVSQAVGLIDGAPGIGETRGDGAISPSFGTSSASERRRKQASSTLTGLESLCGKRNGTVSDDTLIGGEGLIGRSEPMRELRRLIKKVARTNAPVWITGESGTGKELIARLIHKNGARSAEPFVAINCGAIPTELVESELFGHMRGSFTGAIADKDGLFRRAEGGTLFLDEVAELPLHVQVKLLRTIQERSVRPVGSSDEIAVDARMLSASHTDLAAEVEAGRFRHDLYYRLNVISIRSPSLRERTGDIGVLVEHVLRNVTEAGRAIPSLHPAAMERLESYGFPGNVRELENLLERAVALADDDVIGVDDLVLRQEGPWSGPPAGLPERRVTGVDGIERQRLLDALDATHWNRKAAADIVGLTYRQFRYRLGRFGIEGPGGR